MGRLGKACQLLSPKGVLFFNFFILSHVVTICTFGPILVDLLELFFGSTNHCHELWLKLVTLQNGKIKLQLFQRVNAHSGSL